jgi:virginiamycin A acetyltransferase
MVDKNSEYPLGSKDLIFLKNFITNPDIIVGDYTYYYDTHNADKFEINNVIVLYNCKLIIGKFCQIAEGTKFIMNGANHQMNGFSTYPFNIFGGDWSKYTPSYPEKGDTIIENDVWFGYQSVIMPGVKIGNGAIIGAQAVVTKNVDPYTIVAGNPAIVIRKRFDDKTIENLEKLQWWDWDNEKITRHIKDLVGMDMNKFSSQSSVIMDK